MSATPVTISDLPPPDPLSYASADTSVPAEPVIQRSDDGLLLIAPPPPVWRMVIGPGLAAGAMSVMFVACIVCCAVILSGHNGIFAAPVMMLALLLFGMITRSCIQMLIRRARFGRRAIRIEITREMIVLDDPASGHDQDQFPLANVASLTVHPSPLLLCSGRVVRIEMDIRRSIETARLWTPDREAARRIQTALREQLLTFRSETHAKTPPDQTRKTPG